MFYIFSLNNISRQHSLLIDTWVQLQYLLSKILLSEKFVIEKIKELYPDHLILSEEDAFAKNIKNMGPVKDQYMWLIDPLDGTNNFYNKLPFFCVSLALVKGDIPIVGVVYNPLSGEWFHAIKGEGAYYERILGGKKFKTNKQKKIIGNLK